MKQKFKKLYCYAVLLVVAIVLLLVLVQKILVISKNDYADIEIKNESYHQAFWQEYHSSVAKGSDWIRDPKVIALRISGYPNIDNNQPESVNLQVVTDKKCIVTVRSGLLKDDSVKKVEYRVELIRKEKDGLWQAEWAGYRHECYRGFAIGWTKNHCE